MTNQRLEQVSKWALALSCFGILWRIFAPIPVMNAMFEYSWIGRYYRDLTEGLSHILIFGCGAVAFISRSILEDRRTTAAIRKAVEDLSTQ
jgi:hypothetical protein